MGCSGHQSPGLFTHPSDKSIYHNKLTYWTDLAKLLERGVCLSILLFIVTLTNRSSSNTGKLDGIFLADVWGGYDVYNGNLNAALSSGSQFP
jgi:hypothetical protein